MERPLVIVPGGKESNIAQMVAAYLDKDTVAMIGRSSRDPFGLWEVPLRALEEAGAQPVTRSELEPYV